MNNLSNVRRWKRKKQIEVANFLDVSISTYRRIEAGTRKLYMFECKKLARYFKCSIDLILYGDDKENEK